MLCRLFLKGPTIRVLLVGTNNCEPGLGPLNLKNGSIAETEIYIRDVRKWFPTKKEIDKWIDENMHAFMAQENRSHKLSKEQCL